MEKGNRPPQSVVEGQVTPEATVKTEKSFEKLKAFVTEAVATQTHQHVLEARGQTTQQWANQWNMMGIYLYTDSTLDEIGKTYGCSRENIRTVIGKGVVRLYGLATHDLQSKYPYASFDFKKPTQLKTSIRRSHARGGRMDEAIERLDTGEKLVELKKKGFSLSWLRSRNIFTEKNYTHKTYSAEFIARLQVLRDPESLPSERQKVLDELNRYMISRRMAKYPVIKLAELVKEVDLKTSGPKANVVTISESLTSREIPCRVIEVQGNGFIMRYGVIAEVDREAVLDVLRTAPELDYLRRKPRQELD